MGSRYTVEAGCGSNLVVYYGTGNLIKALWKLWAIKIDKKDIYWKSLKIN